MPEIMRHYGQTILVAVAGMLLCALLFVSWPNAGGNVLADIGARSTTQIENTGQNASGAATQRFDDRAKRTRPQARFIGRGNTADTTFDLIDGFRITDADGATWSSMNHSFTKGGKSNGGSLDVVSISAANAPTVNLADNPAIFNRTTGLVAFPEAGVYQVRLKIFDRDNVGGVYAFNLSVDTARTE